MAMLVDVPQLLENGHRFTVDGVLPRRERLKRLQNQSFAPTDLVEATRRKRPVVGFAGSSCWAAHSVQMTTPPKDA